ncbi:helicase RepA family protein [Paenarthrobacter sp. AR 02]|uniref:AAA family ATPase n=1 Tax=Paenarthrobacter sp. AR 02 TaxID=2899821 RepID=UPI001F2FB3D9|nr:AAA family ATPase [Paenarthrobacter sp. AR 02]MCF3137665.1 helicase RepA family protein [Paenarthrobacter sp. AR 02]
MPNDPLLPERPSHHAFTLGGDFMFNMSEGTPAWWGEGQDILAARGESTIICGPPGVGKTTLTGQLVAGSLFGGRVLDMPVAQCERLLYIASDRPQQIARSLRRNFTRDQHEVVNERLVIWKGPPPADMAKNPDLLRDMCLEAGADRVVVDSLKDVAIGLSEDAVGAGYNNARQKALAAGVDVLELHHQVKRGADGGAPNTLSDVYGSTWLTGGAGSVILLSGKPGDTIVDFRHLKQPSATVGPFKVMHDHASGTSSVWNAADPLAMIQASRGQGITAREYAAALFEKDKPTPNEIEKARRKLTAMNNAGSIAVVELPAINGGNPSKVYRMPTVLATAA